ncbi:helicase sen1 isoform X1 [Daucus carota subsp. sativus]|uniref:helicase sen1 isoform X1 n=2 Tax=Daucus carota subsp. sativus TaxID=79200 RepID=UPI0007B2E025|nr:PREDICTED: helicase sen1-like [Daucus carota subsp. sativus]
MDEESSLIDIVFSWSLPDILNHHLYKHKVEQIPDTFSSLLHYMNSFTFPLIEETRADLCSSITNVSKAPTFQVLEIKDAEPASNMNYAISIGRNQDIEFDADMYEPGYGDLIAFTVVRPKCGDDLYTDATNFTVALVQRVKIKKDNVVLLVTSSKPIDPEESMHKKLDATNLFVVFLMNLTTNLRIWEALKFQLDGRNAKIINKVLQHDFVIGRRCNFCFKEGNYRITASILAPTVRSFSLNTSQAEAVSNSFAMKYCCHENSVKLIWGPPGTGKTKTVAVLLYALLEQKCRTVTCAPTNIAVLEVAARLLRLVTQSNGYETYGLGDIILLGNRKRMKIDDHTDLLNIFLDYRTKILLKCFAPKSGWTNCLSSLISLVEDPEEQYRLYLRNEKYEESDEEDGYDEEEVEVSCAPGNRSLKYTQEKNVWKEVIVKILRKNDKKINWRREDPSREDKHSKSGRKKQNDFSQNQKVMNFEDFFRSRFFSKREFMKFCIVNLLTHLPTSFISLDNVKNMMTALRLLESFGTSLHSDAVNGIGLKDVLAQIMNVGQFVNVFSILKKTRKELLNILKSLYVGISVPNIYDEYSIRMFCLQNACLFFCTASSSSKLHVTSMELLVVDEAAQLKECESNIPLQLPGLRHAILVGDEMQLSALVKSQASDEAGFGRSLFTRLVSLGYKKDLLDIQYRMHPSISLFPNKEFYHRQIADGPNVRQKNYQKHILRGDMYGSYSFINIPFGREESCDGYSLKNRVEVAVIAEVVANLFKESTGSKQKLSVGVISPYNAQVVAIQENFGTRYSMDPKSDFSVTVRSIDGFQGGEEDVILLSTVRCNGNGSVGFLSNCQRANVALTRARYCLWIFGNEATLRGSRSVWRNLINDAKNRRCYYNAQDDHRLAKTIVATLVDIDRFEVSLSIDSLLFQEAKWKVCFSNNFWTSMSNIQNIEIRKETLSHLTKLSNGLRWPCNDKSRIVIDGKSAQLVELCKVNCMNYIVWSVDVVKVHSSYSQVLKVWDMLPLSKIPNLLKDMDYSFGSYNMDLMYLCTFKKLEGTLEVPVTWPVHSDVARKITLPGTDPMQHLCSTFAAMSLNDN